MIYIVLRTGKVLQYNEGGSCEIEGGAIAIRPYDGKSLIARIPLDIIERAEFDRPCAVLQEKKNKRAKRYP